LKIAALDIGGTAIKHCLYDSQQKFDRNAVAETPTNAAMGGKALMNTVCELLSAMGGFDRIAVSTAGQVDPKTGSIIFATDNIPGYTGTQVKALLEDRFGTPAVVENDVNAAALGEAVYGAGEGYRDLLCLTYGTGIGGAVILNGEIYYGSSYSAGEFGHILTHAGGLKCTCGNRGCYEAYASTKALIRTVREYSGLELDGRGIFSAIGGNQKIEQAVLAWTQEVLWGLVSLIHVFNPPCVILGGGIMNENYIINSIRTNIGRELMPNYRKVEVKKAALGNTAGLLGVIHLAENDEKKECCK
jgi:Transcriptional regulator/sugar kinase